MSEEKFIGYFRLVEACAKPGCPVCRCVTHESRGYLDALLYEQVTDPDTRRAIRASWGFCHRHTWMLLDIQHSIFGSAIIYDDLVKLALRQTEHLGTRAGRPRRRGWLSRLIRKPGRLTAVELYRARAACPVCTRAADAERHCLGTLVTFIDDGDLQAAYASSDGLCVPHLFAALECNGERPEAEMLVDRTREKWEKLSQQISSFVGKHDYRNREPYTEAETASYGRAFEMLVGAPAGLGQRRPPPAATRTPDGRAAHPPRPIREGA
jgi:hypothetical protein